MSRFKQWKNPRTNQWVKYDRERGKIVNTSDEKFNLEEVEPPKDEDGPSPDGGKKQNNSDNSFTFF